MELLVRRAAVSGSRVALQHAGAVSVPIATYRSKSRDAKRSAGAGKKPSAPHNNRRSGGDARQQQQHRERSNSAAEAAAAAAPPRDLEKEWSDLRARTISMPPPVVPLRTRQEIQNKMRMRRLGLLSEEDEADDFDMGMHDPPPQQRESKREPRQQQQQRDHQQQYNRSRGGQDEDSHHRFPSRNPVAAKDKQFANMQTAPDDVVDREFLMPDEPDEPRALDVAVIGRPNAGKSSIMNELLDVTISAVSAKYNTTRDRALGILTKKDSQIAFYDTPGLIKPKESHEYVRSLVTTAAETVQSVDLSMLVVDSVKRLDEHAMEALEKVITTSAQEAAPIMLVMNKYDLVGDREELNLTLKIKDLSQMIEEIYGNHYDADESSLEIDPLSYIGDNALKVSATKGYGMKRLKKTLLDLAVDRPWSYHSSVTSDRSDLDLVTEIIREKLFRRFNKELPYSFEQENIGWTKFKDNSVRIDQDIFVPAPRIRKMVIGKNGDTIRQVGIAARYDIEALLKRPVHLYLNVRVR